MQWTKLGAGSGLLVSRIGPCFGHLGHQRDDCVERRVDPLDSGEVGCEEFPGGDLAATHHSCQICGRSINEVHAIDGNRLNVDSF